MRDFFCKFYCPSLICFYNPSPQFLSPSPLKLESTHLSSLHDAEVQLSDEKAELKKESLDGKEEQAENFLKSSLKKPPSELGAPKGRVQWTDSFGKELVEIMEFEPSSESEDSDGESEDNRSCVCAI